MNKLLVTLLIVGASLGCNRTESGMIARAVEHGKALVAPLVPGPAAEQFSDSDTYLDLSAQAGLAQVDVQGWFIDLGSAGQSQYTMGDWRSGWGKRGEEQGITYTEVGSRGRLYLSLDQASDLRVTLRLKPQQNMPITLYTNEFAIESLTLQGGPNYQEVQFTVPAAKVRPGENVILFHFGKPQVVNGVQLAGRIDWVRVEEGSAAAHSTSGSGFSFSELVGQAKVGNDAKDALRLPAQSRLRFTVDLPAPAKLVFSAGTEQPEPVNARVVVSTDGKASETLWKGTLKDAWTNVAVDLNDKTSPIRIDLIAEGSAGQRIAWHKPRIILKSASAPPSGAVAPKNVIVLVIDTQRADKLSAFNPETYVKSPVIEGLAKEGSVFLAAQSPENWTKPACASVLTGLHPMTHRQKFDDSRLPASALLLSEHLKAQGMSTAMLSANGYVSEKFGFKQGWDYYTNYIREQKSTKAEFVFRDAGKWIETNKDKPFFVYIQTIEPHVPYDPPAEYLKMYDSEPYAGPVKPRLTADLLEKAKRVPPAITFSERDKKYIEALHDGDVTYHDAELGRFIERLKTLGVWEQTLLVITADHGEEFNDHGSWGHGHSVFQELLHVPLLFRFPGRVPQGQRIESTVASYDIAATVLDLLGKPPLPHDEGHSLVPFFEGRTPSRPLAAFSDFQDDRRVIRAGRWKYILRGNLSATLFDLEKDPDERQALDARAFPIAQSYCRAMLGQFLGAKDRRDWHLLRQKTAAVQLSQESAEMDEATKAQLKALGYAK